MPSTILLAPFAGWAPAMRAAVLLLAATLWLPAALAQPAPAAAPAAVEVLTDAAADVHAQAQGQDQAVPQGRYAAMDLLAASLQETVDKVVATLKVSSLAAEPGNPVDDVTYTLRFTYQGLEYGIVVERYGTLTGEHFAHGYLARFDSGTMNRLGSIQVMEDPATNTIVATVNRNDITDANGAMPFPGRSLGSFWAETHLPYANQPFIYLGVAEVPFPADFTDRMPDSGMGTVTFPIQLGLRQEGHALLSSTDPMRASNGEATTFVFSVAARNLAEGEDLFRLTTANVPADWSVLAPDEYLRLAGGESRDVPVLATVPFTHTHGEAKEFTLEMRSTTDSATVGRVALGVRYHLVPQPAGHHPDLFLHSRAWGDADSPVYTVASSTFAGSSGYAYMNALQEDPLDDGIGLTGAYSGIQCCDPTTGQAQARWRWWAFLSPSLDMGLDFDLAGQGTLTVPVKTTAPIRAAQLEGVLYYWTYDPKADAYNETIVASLAPTAPQDLGAGDSRVLELPFKPTAAADFLPYAKRNGLFMELNMTSSVPALFLAAEAPVLAPGAVLRLPLVEYHDPLADAFRSKAQVELAPVGELHRDVNPGRTAVFQASLTNLQARAGAFEVKVEGVNKEWLEVLTPGPIPVEAGLSAPIRVALHVPASATAVDGADFVLTVQDSEDPTQRAMVHFVGRVVAGSDIPDEAPQVEALREEPAKATPGLEFAAVALGMAAVALVRRRQKA